MGGNTCSFSISTCAELTEMIAFHGPDYEKGGEKDGRYLKLAAALYIFISIFLFIYYNLCPHL